MARAEASFKSRVLDSDKVVAVAFTAPWCGHCKALHPEWNSFAKKTKGLITVANVDATVHQGLAQRYGVQGYPTIKFFNAGKAAKQSPEDYNGARKAGPLAKFALGKLENHVVKVSASNSNQLANDGMAKVVLFTAKKDVGNMFKALSTYYRGVRFAQVHESQKELMEEFGVTSVPTVVGMDAEGAITPFTDDISYINLAKFTKVTGGDAAKDATAAAKAAAKARPPPPPKAAKVVDPATFEAACPNKRRCIVSVVDSSLPTHADDLARANGFAESYKKDDVLKFFVVDVAKPDGKQFAATHGVDAADAPTLFAYHPKRRKVAKASVAFDAASTFIDNVLGGTVTYAGVDL